MTVVLTVIRLRCLASVSGQPRSRCQPERTRASVNSTRKLRVFISVRLACISQPHPTCVTHSLTHIYGGVSGGHMLCAGDERCHSRGSRSCHAEGGRGLPRDKGASLPPPYSRPQTLSHRFSKHRRRNKGGIPAFRCILLQLAAVFCCVYVQPLAEPLALKVQNLNQ